MTARDPLTLSPSKGTRIWRGIEAQDPPWAAGDYPDLLAMAESMLAARRNRFPVLVREGRMTQADADAELATFAAIAADWRWIVTGEGEPAHLATLEARRTALDASLDTIAAIVDERRDFSRELALQAQRVIAMRWHLEPDSQTHFYARLTHELRARLQSDANATARPAPVEGPNRKAA